MGFIAGVTATAGKGMCHAGALISGGADTADAKLAIMEECGFTITRNPSEMACLLKGLAPSERAAARGPAGCLPSGHRDADPNGRGVNVARWA